MQLKTVAICAVVLLVSGCGYEFQGSGSVLPADVKRVYIPIAENNSTEPALALLVTEAVRDRFERFGVVSIVDEQKDADAILQAKVLKVKHDTNTVSGRADTALQQNTTLSLAAELRRVSGPVLWRNPNLSVTKVFGSTAGSVVTTSADFAGSGLSSSDIGSLDSRELARGQEQQALSDLADLAARRIYDDAVAPDF